MPDKDGRWLPTILILSVAFCWQRQSLVADETAADDEDARPGLRAVFSDSTHSVTRVDRRLSFDWADCAAESRIADDFKATWTGNLLVRQPGNHVFHAMLAGKVRVQIDGTDVLEASSDSVFYSGQPVNLSAGDHQLKVTFERRPKGDAKLQLFWSSPDFTLEPLPADILSHEPEDSNNARLEESGRLLTDALRCSACHQGISELPTLTAPNLAQVKTLAHGNVTENIVARLTASSPEHAYGSMPTFEFSRTDAEDIAAFLLDAASEDTMDSKEPKFKPEDADAGARLLITTGCVACHQVPQMATQLTSDSNPYHGPDLAQLSAHRSSQWLMTWLQSPQKLNSNHRMPVFSLTDDERRQIVASLLQSDIETTKPPAKKGDSTTAESIAAGRTLVVAANCGACHKIPGIESPEAKLARPFSGAQPPFVSSCIASKTDSRPVAAAHQPQFLLNDLQRKQLSAWLISISSDLRTATHFSKGQLLLQRNGCLACHDRDQLTGLSKHAGSIESTREDLRGQSQALIPPPLTAVGDRLRDEYLLNAVAGEQTSRRLPWLLVRMPKFDLSKEDRESVVEYFIASDRIPDIADAARPELFEYLNPHHPSLATPAELLTGNQLIGASGFNCIACHKAGSYEPRNVAMGTRGSDIMTMGQRVRPRYFMRWMQNPIRVVPGIEMPAIRKPVAGVLEDSLPQQIAGMWKALADPKFSPPTVLSRYEQLVTVAPGQRPRIVRDVFTIGESKERTSVPRAFAVGFENGHNILLDLDSLQLRQWSIGEFARQRTEGKSWFWDMAGVAVQSRETEILNCGLKLDSRPSEQPLRPLIDQQRLAELLSYRVDDRTVTLRLRYHFETGRNAPAPQKAAAELSRHTELTAWNDPSRQLVSAIVKFTLQVAEKIEDTTGWTVSATVEECPGNDRLVFDAWRSQQSIETIPWTAVVDSAPIVVGNSSDSSDVLALGKGQSARMQYRTKVVPPVIVPASIPKIQSSADVITSVPGFRGQRLPVPTDIMPTAMTWQADGSMALTSLRGHVWIARDTNGDSLPDAMSLFAEGLSAPFGIQSDGDAILVSHKPEILRLRDSDGDGSADQFDVVASGWGFNDDYHDWTTGLVRDQNGQLFVGLGSDYSQNKRPADNDRWRGTVLKIDSTGAITPIAYSFRFPMGLAFDRYQHLFVTDNQGVQNTFNEINHVIPGKHYGVPSRHESAKEITPEIPSLMVPHPWTRSVNSILFLPDDFEVPELAGHGIGCEYDTRCLIRFTVQDVDGTLQGASYRFSRPDQPGGGNNFVGPVTSGIGRDGALYIGSIWDSGWQGGSNTGSIERLIPEKPLPNGIREIIATKQGFQVSFFHPVDAAKAQDPKLWSLQGYTRSWSGSYATQDSDRHSLTPAAITLSADQLSVTINTDPFKAGYVYEITIKEPLDASKEFWPSEGFYSMKVVPK